MICSLSMFTISVFPHLLRPNPPRIIKRNELSLDGMSSALSEGQLHKSGYALLDYLAVAAIGSSQSRG